MAHWTKRMTVKGEPRWDVEWRTHEGKVQTKTFVTRRHADDFITRLNHDRLTGFSIDPDGGKLTVRELSDRWLGSNPGKRSNTIGRDRSALRKHILPAIGERELRTIQQTEVQGLVNEWSAFLGPRTVDRTYGTLRAAFAYAIDSDLFPRSPCRNVNLPRAVPRRRPVLTPDDVGRLANAMGPNRAGNGLGWGTTGTPLG